jgi:hypothetical protein
LKVRYPNLQRPSSVSTRVPGDVELIDQLLRWRNKLRTFVLSATMEGGMGKIHPNLS